MYWLSGEGSMRSSFFRVSVLILCVLFLMRETSIAQYEQPAGENPPVAQPLVREGDFALKLAPALGLGTPANEAEAESKLSSAGISPKNGWIADYPVTPDIVGEVQTSVGEAADAGSLSMGKDTALTAVQNVVNESNLSVRTEGPGETQAPGPGTTVINNYYTTEGPPVVTYYAPPPDYAYLYTWVPFPFWWWDFWFPGFFVLVDFDIRVVQVNRVVFISNHFREFGTRRFVRIDPTNRFRGGTFTGTNRFRGGTTIGSRFQGGTSTGMTGGTRGFRAPVPSGNRSSVFQRFGNSRFEGRASDRGFQSRSRSGQMPSRPAQMPGRVFRDSLGGTFHGGGGVTRGGGGGGGETRGGGSGGHR